MKRGVFLVIVGAIVIFVGYIAYVMLTTRSHSPQETIQYRSGNLEISLTYCKPFKKGRKIFGGLVPYGEYWRTGANEATEISFSQKVNFAGKPVPAGQYRLYSIPGPNEWTVVLNTELGQWGAFAPNPDLDHTKVTVPSRSLPTIAEQFTIFFEQVGEENRMIMQWDKTEVIVPIK